MNHMRLARQKQIVCGVLLSFLCVWLGLASPARAVSEDPFPTFACIQPNVEFWKKVYTALPSTRGYIHDSDDPSVIYGVVELQPDDEPGARRTNQKRVKKAKEHYRLLLKNMVHGKSVDDPEAQKIRQALGGTPSKQRLLEAAQNIRFQRCLKDRFQEGLVRSGLYIERMKKIFRENDLPEDLVYLPHVESSFNYEAYSKFGAAGIWQFIRSTGKRFLHISYDIDERRDPIRATQAAASYLKENYAVLGSWPLALTAYNHGANGMKRANQRHGGYEKVFKEYTSRTFGFASRNFYAEFLAAREVAADYLRYFPGLELQPPARFVEYELPAFAAVHDLASHFQVDLELVKRMNPALRSPVFKGQKYVPKGYRFRLPKSTEITQRLAMVPDTVFHDKQKRSRFYRVNRGDTAGKIARMHNVSLRDLAELNNLDRRATIYAGQNLRIPTPAEEQKMYLAAKSLKKKPLPAPVVVAELEKENRPAPVALVPAHVTDADELIASAVYQREDESDLLAQIAHDNADDGDVPDSPETENLASGELTEELGEALEPAKDLAEASSFAINPEIVYGNILVEDIRTQKGRQYGAIRVEAWETLGHYADWLEIPTMHIRRLNGLKFGQSIHPNQKLTIPLDKVSKDVFEERRYEYHKEIEEDFFTAFKVVGIQSYSIQKGDTIWDLCREVLEIPFWLMKKYNTDIDFEKLRLNQKLVVPVVEKIG